jgi:hypothetical protein
VVLTAVPLDIMVIPLLSPERYLAYMRALHLAPDKTEVAHERPLPQIFDDQFGWPELVRQIADLHWSLPPEERAQTGIYASKLRRSRRARPFRPALRAAARYQRTSELLALGHARLPRQELDLVAVASAIGRASLGLSRAGGGGKPPNLALPRAQTTAGRGLARLQVLELG